MSRVTNQLARPERRRSNVIVRNTSRTVIFERSSSFASEAAVGADELSFSPVFDLVLRCRTSDIVMMVAGACGNTESMQTQDVLEGYIYRERRVIRTDSKVVLAIEDLYY